MFSLTQYWSRKGHRARDAKQWLSAQRAYSRALQRNPELAPIWVQYGHSLKEAGSVQEALAAYRKADALQPDLADTQLQISHALRLLGQEEPSLEHLMRSLALKEGPTLHRPKARPADMPERLRFVALGTTGTCNASCVHCPTGKSTTAHAPRGTMPMDLFQKIIDGIRDFQLPVTDQISFGLFGDGLVDPLVMQRATYLRTHLPNACLSINTNGASFNAAKHSGLRDIADTLALHCESLDPETYNYLMAPLRLERVKPKMEEILAVFGDKVHVSVPITTRNRGEAASIESWFMERGARKVVFDPISSRCAEDRTVFNSLALNPHPIRCSPVVMDDLIVDCDGQVLMCCQDFQRVEGIGNLATESFAEVVAGVHRQNIRKRFAEMRHEEFATCSRCYADLRGDFVPA